MGEVVKEKEAQLLQLRFELTQGQTKAKVDGAKATLEVTTHVSKISSLEKELSEIKAAKVLVQQQLDQASEKAITTEANATERFNRFKDMLRLSKAEVVDLKAKLSKTVEVAVSVTTLSHMFTYITCV